MHAVLPRFHVLHPLRMQKAMPRVVPAVMTDESSPPSSSGGHGDVFTSAESSLVDDIEGKEQETEMENEDESRNEPVLICG